MGRSQVVFAICLFLISFALAEEASTSVSIENTPPFLIQNISDIIIFSGMPSLNVIDLDDYFFEANGDELNITYSTLENVTILIDSENRVSFYPDYGYEGNQTMYFSVSDSEGTAISNNFTLSVGIDIIAPKWSTPARNRYTVFQNHHVNFTTVWHDNSELDYFIFSIKQASSWVNSSSVDFSGSTNISKQKAQISASAGSVVYWRFYAADIYGNMNVTDIQNFTVQEFVYTGEIPEFDPDDIDEDLDPPEYTTTTGYSVIEREIEEDDEGLETSIISGYKTDTEYIKATLRQGDSLTKVVKITNTGDVNLNFLLKLTEIEDFAFLSDYNFSLEPGETKQLLVEFNISEDAMPDQYFGMLILRSDQIVKIPIVLDIRKFESEISLSIKIPNEYKYVNPKDKVVAKIKVENLKDIRETNSTLFYAIKDFDGNIIESNTKEFQLFAFFEEDLSLTIPKDTKEDEYIFYARVISGDNVDLDSDLFFIINGNLFWRFLMDYFYEFLILLLLLIILILYLAEKRSKKKRRILELYLLLNELRELVKEGKTSEALDIYKKIKIVYGLGVPKNFKEDKEKMKVELDKFSKILKQNPISENPKKPAEPKPAEPKSAEDKPSEPQPKPAETKPATKPAETKPITKPKPEAKPKSEPKPKLAEPVKSQPKPEESSK